MIIIDSKLYGKPHNWKIGQFEVIKQSRGFTVPDNGVYEILGMNCGADGGNGYGDKAEGKSKRGGGGGGSSGEILTMNLTEGSICDVFIGTQDVYTPNGKFSYFNGESFTALVGTNGGNANVLTVGTGGRGFGSLGHNGMSGSGGSSAGVIYGGDGGAGYVYEGVEYGKGGQGGSYNRDTPGKGTDGIVIVTLVRYL